MFNAPLHPLMLLISLLLHGCGGKPLLQQEVSGLVRESSSALMKSAQGTGSAEDRIETAAEQSATTVANAAEGKVEDEASQKASQFIGRVL